MIGLGGGQVGKTRSVDIHGNESVTRRFLDVKTEITETDHLDATIDGTSTRIKGLRSSKAPSRTE